MIKRTIIFAILLVFSSVLNAAPIGPVGIALGTASGVLLGSASSGGIKCLFNFGQGDCKGKRNSQQEDARQERIQTENLLQIDKLNQEDTTFGIAATAEINKNQIENILNLNTFRIDANNLLTSNTVQYGTKLASDLNENLQVNHALQSKILNGGSNNAKNLVDFGVFSSQTPKQRTQTEYDEIFSS